MKEDVVDLWKKELKHTGYKHSFKSCKKVKKIPRVWKKIFKYIPNKKLSILDIGSGGGRAIAMLALNGHKCVGYDISSEVIERSNNYINEIENRCAKLDIKVELTNIFEIDENKIEEQYDIVCHFGVIEHFLDKNDRLMFLDKMYKLTKKGGFVISVVPSGMHPLREEQRRDGLGGYIVPEIDYSDVVMYNEFDKFHFTKIDVLPHNMFNYLGYKKQGILIDKLKRIMFLLAQLIPVSFFSKKFAFNHCGSIIGIAQK